MENNLYLMLTMVLLTRGPWGKTDALGKCDLNKLFTLFEQMHSSSMKQSNTKLFKDNLFVSFLDGHNNIFPTSDQLS